MAAYEGYRPVGVTDEGDLPPRVQTKVTEKVTTALVDDLEVKASEFRTAMDNAFGLVVSAADPIFGGLVADGDITALTGTDNTAALKAASAAAANGVLTIPAGVYRITDTFPIPKTLVCNSPGVVTILNTTPGQPVAASRNWLTAIGGAPAGRGAIRGIRFCGPGGTVVDANNHGLIIRDYRMDIENVCVMNVGGDGFVLTHLNQAGVATSGTLVENWINGLEVRGVAGRPVLLGPANNNKITDGFIDNVVVQCTSTSPNGVFAGSAAGWQIGEIHTYGTPAGDAIRLLNCFRTQVGRLYVEAFPSGSYALNLNVQQDVTIESLMADMPAGGGTAVYITKADVYPSQFVSIGALALRMDSDVACAAVKNTSSLINVQVANWRAFGTFRNRIALQGGSTASDVVRSMAGARAVNGRALFDRGDGVEVASSFGANINWNGSSAQSIEIPIPLLSSFSKRSFIVTIGSKANHNTTTRARWAGMVWVSAKDNNADAWTSFTLDMIAAVGFAVNPTVSVVHDANGYGKLVVSFTATDSDAYGSVSVIGT